MSDDLEQNLWFELENFDQIFSDSTKQEAAICDEDAPKFKKIYTAYELAEAEGEKEQLEDRLHELLSKTEEFDGKLLELTQRNLDLTAENEKLSCENIILNEQITKLTSVFKYKIPNSFKCDLNEEDFREMEFKLAETRSKLARTLQTYDDLTLMKDFALKQLEQEKLARIHVEKERDAYSAAYEASLTHFDKWSKSKSSAQF
jgi:hypothetical protein